MLDMEIRKYRPYADITLVVGNTSVKLGMLDLKSIDTLRYELRVLEKEITELYEGFLEYLLHSAG